MIRSIKYFLLVSLLVSIGILSILNGIGNYLLDEQVLHPFWDRRLIRISHLLSLVHHSIIYHPAICNQLFNYVKEMHVDSPEKFFFQIRDPQDQMLFHSSYQPSRAIMMQTALEKIPLGFSNKIIGSDRWRLYAKLDNQKNKIIVAELHDLRHELAMKIVQNNTRILLITSPIFGLLVWIIITYALQSIARVTVEISSRASTYLEPVQLTNIPVEIKPLVLELNMLFERLKKAFKHNERFAANAAHELRTPLAALRTYAELALRSNNEKDQHHALYKLIKSVNRSSRVITQLLTLSQLRKEKIVLDWKPFRLYKLAVEVIADLVPSALKKHIEVILEDPLEDGSSITLMGNEIEIGILIRNIVDNAIRYTPVHGKVTIRVLQDKEHVLLQVIDTGMGIPVALRQEVFEGFYRLLRTQESGSGLGLAIVQQIAMLHHAEINLRTPANGVGLQFSVAFLKDLPLK